MKTFLSKRFTAEHLIEFRAICGSNVRRFWATLMELDAIEPDLRALDASGWDVYAGVNPRSLNVVRQLVCFHADIDATISFGDKPPHKESLLEPFGWGHVPEPSLIVNSGHGRHLYWTLDSPMNVNDANREHLKAINRGLAKLVGADSACCDLARILRVPGFHNHKDSPPAEVRLISDTGFRYPFALFESVAIEDGLNQTANMTRHTQPVGDISPELDQRFRRLWGHNPEVKRAWRGEIGDGSSDSRYVLVKRLKEHGFNDEEILAIVCSRRWYNRHRRRVRPASDVIRDTSRLLSLCGVFPAEQGHAAKRIEFDALQPGEIAL